VQKHLGFKRNRKEIKDQKKALELAEREADGSGSGGG
jgi:hypothetical protein